jgi:hypothetical protein
MASPPPPSWKQLSTCTICEDPMFYPLFFSCKQHAACFRCVFNKTQHEKLMVMDISSDTGVSECYSVSCKVCGAYDNASQLHELINKMTTPPLDWVKKFHAQRTDASSAMCPFCFELILHELDQGYDHLRICSKRPMLCKLCNQHIHQDKYSEHLRKQCSEFFCTVIGCKDGHRRGMKLETIRAHMMSHDQYKSAKDNVISDFLKIIESMPNSTETQRLNFSKNGTAGLAAFVQAVKKNLGSEHHETNS